MYFTDPIWEYNIVLDFPKGNVLCEARHAEVVTNVCSKSVDHGVGVDPQLTKRGSTVNFHFHMKRQSPLLILGGGRSTIDKERINSQLSLLCEKAITSVDPGWEGADLQSTKRINSQLSLLHEKVIASVDLGGGSTINKEDQQSAFTFA